MGLFPKECVWPAIRWRAQKTSDELDLTGKLFAEDRFHTSLVHISDRKRVRSKDRFAADLAAQTVRIAPFEIVLSRLGSLPGVPRSGRPIEHPLVLLADDGAVMNLQAALSAGLRQLRYRVPDVFRPHLTISYNRQFVPVRAIDPITFLVSEFALVHSRLWRTEYNILKTWRLH